MTRSEFLSELRKALKNESLGSGAIQENLKYYQEYIVGEVEKGRDEKDVLDELGDPWILAKNIVEAPGSEYYQSENCEEVYNESAKLNQEQQDKFSDRSHIYRFDTWYKKLFLLLTVLLIIVLIIVIITGVVSLLAPIVVPILVIMFVIRLFDRRS